MRPMLFRGGSAGASPAPTPPASLLAAEFPAAFQVFEFGVGLLYGSVPRATAGNTSTTVIALTGVIAGVAVPIWVVATNSASIGSGATFNVYYDGLGVTPAMAGVTPSAGTPVALTGAGLGLSLTWTAGTSVNTNSWKATCAGIADQSGNGQDGAQIVLASQLLVTAGLNGKPGLLGAAGATMATSLGLPACGTTPRCGGIVVRRPATAGSARLITDTCDANNLVLPTTNTIQVYLNGHAGPIGTGLPADTWGAVDWGLSNSADDYIKTGSGPMVTGAGAGDGGSCQMSFGGVAAEYLAVIHAPQSGFSSAAFRAAVTAIWGAGVAV